MKGHDLELQGGNGGSEGCSGIHHHITAGSGGGSGGSGGGGSRVGGRIGVEGHE